ncbi:hypothetical protein LR69_00865 [Geobacillus sp. BCO2]|nr:hypothetical protein LR69_00865 [Geobacillus sp. BCO2]
MTHTDSSPTYPSYPHAWKRGMNWFRRIKQKRSLIQKRTYVLGQPLFPCDRFLLLRQSRSLSASLVSSSRFLTSASV